MIYIIITIFYGVVVSAFGFNPNDPGSNPGRRFLFLLFLLFLLYLLFNYVHI
jgi:hypothetical protein